jgi:hypothetical protein
MGQGVGRPCDRFDDLISERRTKRLADAFRQLEPRERQLLTAALAGNHPDGLSDLRPDVIRALATAERYPRG